MSEYPNLTITSYKLFLRFEHPLNGKCYLYSVEIYVKATKCGEVSYTPASIKINGVEKIYGEINNGIYLVVINNRTGEVVKSQGFSKWGKLNEFYKSITNGFIVVAATQRNCGINKLYIPKEIIGGILNETGDAFYAILCKGGWCRDKKLPIRFTSRDPIIQKTIFTSTSKGIFILNSPVAHIGIFFLKPFSHTGTFCCKTLRTNILVCSFYSYDK